jgi:hypothetical protein
MQALVQGDRHERAERTEPYVLALSPGREASLTRSDTIETWSLHKLPTIGTKSKHNRNHLTPLHHASQKAHRASRQK